MYLAVLVVVVVYLCVNIASTSPDQHQLDLKNHYEHLTYVAHFKCLSPQPKALKVLKLLPACDTDGKAYFPDLTVLHRCGDDIGCCSPGFRCDPYFTETVRLPFKVTYLEAVEKHKRGSWAMKYHDFDNHTECICTGGINPRET